MRCPTPTILVLFGITGDLSKRKLLPALASLAMGDHLPESFRLIGVTRRPNLTKADILKTLPNSDALQTALELWPMDVTQPAEYDRLASYLDSLQRDQPAAQRLFFLSVPPEASTDIINGLGYAGLGRHPQTKLLLEKPFGRDLESAQGLIKQIAQYFQTNQVYRMDHYLAKEQAQNLLVMRQCNPFIERSWNREGISRIDIIGSEQIGIEGRTDHYEQTGALIDFAQSHLFQLAALTLMDLPTNPTNIAERRIEALRSLRLDLHRSFRAQYDRYRQDVQQLTSTTETFVSLTLESISPRWKDVPIRLVTGKGLKEKRTEIILTFHDPASKAKLTWPLQDGAQPSFQLLQKKPGYLHDPIELTALQSTTEKEGPEAYEHIFLNAIQTDHRLFVSEEEILTSWQLLKPLQEQWQLGSDDLKIYPFGSDVDQVS